MSRVEYWNDPGAPAPNSLVPACGVLAVDAHGRVLLQRRRDTGQWALPMGKMELGETPSGCAIRETREETGITVEVTGLLGVFSDPGHIVAYGDGEIRQEYEVILLARPVSGTPASNDEASDVRWVPPADLGGLDIHPTQRRQLGHYFNRTYPHVDLARKPSAAPALAVSPRVAACTAPHDGRASALVSGGVVPLVMTPPVGIKLTFTRGQVWWGEVTSAGRFRMARWARGVFVALASADTLLAGAGWNRQRWLTKPLLMPVLMTSSDRGSRPALALGGAGDMVLLGGSDAAFTAGLACFLAGHAAWIHALRQRPGGGLRSQPVLAVPYLAAFGALNAYLWPRTGKDRLPVLAYSAALLAMSLAALDSGSRRTAAGGALFLVSDTLLALEKFAGLHLPAHEGVVMATYTTAQALLASPPPA